MASHLEDVFNYHGWSIAYSLLKPNKSKTYGSSLKTVVFVHGTPWTSDVFLPITKALFSTQKYNILLYDLLGYGYSQTHGPTGSTTVNDTSTRTQADLLASLLHHLHIDGKDNNEKPIVVAHDIAGVISLRAHLLHECQYASLCLLDTNVVLPWGDKFYNLVRDNPRIFNDLPNGIFENVVRAVVRSASANDLMPSHWEETLVRHWAPKQGTVTDKELESRQKSFVKQISDSNDADVAEMLDQNLYSKVACDVKILWGEKDSWIPREKMEELQSMLGDRVKAFVIIPDAGHLIMIDQPERVMFEIGTWVASTK